jgi:hypothetical protein
MTKSDSQIETLGHHVDDPIIKPQVDLNIGIRVQELMKSRHDHVPPHNRGQADLDAAARRLARAAYQGLGVSDTAKDLPCAGVQGFSFCGERDGTRCALKQYDAKAAFKAIDRFPNGRAGNAEFSSRRCEAAELDGRCEGKQAAQGIKGKHSGHGVRSVRTLGHLQKYQCPNHDRCNAANSMSGFTNANSTMKRFAMKDQAHTAVAPPSRRGFIVASGAVGASTVLACASAQAQSGDEKTPATKVVLEFLNNTAPDKIEAAVARLVAEDATYISLNFDNPELKKILPWTGTQNGRKAYTSTFIGVANYWTIEDFKISDAFGAGENVSVFGSFTYRSKTRGKLFRSPLAIHAKVKDGKIVYFMFMEDTFASARSFSSGGKWKIKTDPKGPEYQV